MRVIVTAVVLLLAAAGGALAHAHLDRASPAVGSTVTPAPKEVVLWFTNQLEPSFSSIEVRDEKGASVQAAKPGSTAATVRNCACRSTPYHPGPTR